MPSPDYFRRQADICIRLSLLASDDEVSNRLIIMARAYMAKSDALTKQVPADTANGAEGSAADGGPEREGVDLRSSGPAHC